MTVSTENQESISAIPLDMQSGWEKTLQATEKLIRPQYFQSFILTIRLLEAHESTLVLGFPEKFFRDWVYDHYSTLIQEKFDEATEGQYKLEYAVEPKPAIEHPRHKPVPVVEQSPSPAGPVVAPLPDSLPTAASRAYDRAHLAPQNDLNSKYGFETFVVGASNQFAHAASFRVAEAPGKHYNPLFIYGGVGLGKTHLLNAIGIKILEKYPHLRVHYTTFEKFTNHMIESIRYERMEEFRERYRKHCDVLIIDDIQFISGKERTQEEFFHTFNTLSEHGKQIVLSSDRPPKDIKELEERLRSRFEMGLIVDIQAPEMETRVAIVFKKAELEGIKIPHDVAFFLAKIFRSNIRELEGALLKLTAYASMNGTELTLDLAKNLFQTQPEAFEGFRQDPEEIMKLVARHFQVSLGDLRSDRRNRQLAVPRQIAMSLIRKYTRLSTPDIGKLFGGKNHSTVIHNVRQVAKQIETDHLLRDTILKLEHQIRENL